MLTVRLTYALLLISLCVQALPLPATPLNERHQEISWQAWLLVDDQNQHKQNGPEGVPSRHRITTKSVFVAPTFSAFSPENLPPCPDGYKSDPMGRCIKIIMLDEASHLEFLVSKLNDKFGDLDYDEEEDEEVPLQVSIPLGGDYTNDPPQEETEFAIIVTPTVKEVDKKSNVDKRDDSDNYEKELKRLAETTTELLHDTTTVTAEEIGEDSNISTTPSQVQEERTTLKPDLTVITEDAQETTTTFFTTPTISAETTTSTESLSTTTEQELTTLVTETPKSSTTTPKITTYHPKATTYHPYFDMNRVGSSKTRNIIKFPDEESIGSARSYSQNNYVRFPDADTKYQQESESHHTRDVGDSFGNFFNEIVTPDTSQKVHRMVPAFKVGFVPSKRYPFTFPHDSNHRQYEYQLDSTTERHHNKRSREKHGGGLFLLPPQWSEKSNPKPLILRFSRKHFHLKPEKLKSNVFYRSLPKEDLSVLFGYDNEQRVNR